MGEAIYYITLIILFLADRQKFVKHNIEQIGVLVYKGLGYGVWITIKTYTPYPS